MKKMIKASLLVLLFGVSVSFAAGLVVLSRGSFSATGTGSAATSLTIPAQKGKIIRNTTLSMSQATNANLSVYRPQRKTTASAASAASTTLKVYTGSVSNKVEGFTPTTSDYMLVNSPTSGYQLEKISAIASFDGTNVTTYTLANAVTCAANDVVYVCDADDIVTIAGLAASDQTEMHYMFVGYISNPVYLTIPATAGTTVLSGTFDAEK